MSAVWMSTVSASWCGIARSGLSKTSFEGWPSSGSTRSRRGRGAPGRARDRLIRGNGLPSAITRLPNASFGHTDNTKRRRTALPSPPLVRSYRTLASPHRSTPELIVMFDYVRIARRALKRSLLLGAIQLKWYRDALHLPLTPGHRELYGIIHRLYWRELRTFPNLINSRDFNDRM